MSICLSVCHSRYTLATKSKVDFVAADLSPFCRKSTVAGSFDNVDRVAITTHRLRLAFCRVQLRWIATDGAVRPSVCLAVCHKPVPWEDKCS